MEISILERIRNYDGTIKSYIVSVDGGKPTELPNEILLSYSDNVVNAYLIKNKYFRAKSGVIIKTTVDNSGLELKRKYKSLKLNAFDTNYYGKGFECVCRKVRKYASLGNIKVDKSNHTSKENLLLIDAIEHIGLDSTLFITSYLQYLQPYMIDNFQRSKKKINGSDDIWLVDLGYRFKLIMKFLIINNCDMLVVSFHESKLKGALLRSNAEFNDKPCAVFIDDKQKFSDYYTVNYIVQRGFMRVLNSSVTKYVNEDIALINHSDIKDIFDLKISKEYDYLVSIYSSITGLETPNISGIKNFSFLSYGYNLLNNISMLIDMYENISDNKLNIEIIDVTNNILSLLDNDTLENLKEILLKKYGIGYNNKLYRLVVGL